MLNTQVENKSWTDSTVSECCKHIEDVHKSEFDKIEANLKIGKIVSDIIESSTYGDSAIRKFAQELSDKRGKIVYPQRLYDACRVYSTVKTIDKAREIQLKAGEDISWDWLVRNATKQYQNEDNKDIKKEIFESLLKKAESSVHNLDKITEHAAEMTKEERHQLIGVAAHISRTANDWIETIGDAEEQGECNENNENNIESIVLNCFVLTDPSVGIFVRNGKWYAPKYGVDTLDALIDAIRSAIR